MIHNLDFIVWLPSITTTSVLAFILWFSRKFIGTRITKSVEYGFNVKLEAVRAEWHVKEELLKADLLNKEKEIDVLRNGTLSAMTNREISLYEKRLKAVEQLWSAAVNLGSAKPVLSMMATVVFETAVEESTKNPQLRKFFETMGSRFDLDKLDLSGAQKARLFVSPILWALFSAYQAIVVYTVMKLEIIKSGTGAKHLLNKNNIAKLIKETLPHQTEYIDEFGDSSYCHILEELEQKLLNEIKKFLRDNETDKASMANAAEIINLSNKVMKDSKDNLKYNQNTDPTKF